MNLKSILFGFITIMMLSGVASAVNVEIQFSVVGSGTFDIMVNDAYFSTIWANEGASHVLDEGTEIRLIMSTHPGYVFDRLCINPECTIWSSILNGEYYFVLHPDSNYIKVIYLPIPENTITDVHGEFTTSDPTMLTYNLFWHQTLQSDVYIIEDGYNMDVINYAPGYNFKTLFNVYPYGNHEFCINDVCTTGTNVDPLPTPTPIPTPVPTIASPVNDTSVYEVTVYLENDQWYFTGCAGDFDSTLTIQDIYATRDQVAIEANHCISFSHPNIYFFGVSGIMDWTISIESPRVGGIVKDLKTFHVTDTVIPTYAGVLNTTVEYIGIAPDYVGCQDVFPDNNSDSLFVLTVKSSTPINLNSVTMQLLKPDGSPGTSIVYASLNNDFCAMGVYNYADILLNGNNIDRTMNASVWGISTFNLRTTWDSLLTTGDKFLVTSRFNTTAASYTYVTVVKQYAASIPTPPVDDTTQSALDLMGLITNKLFWTLVFIIGIMLCVANKERIGL